MLFTTPMAPSRHLPPLGIPDISRRINPSWWKVFDMLLGRAWKQTIDSLYIREGVPPEKSILQDVWSSPLLNLVAVSPALFSPPPDWKNRYHVCGFLNIPEKEKWSMPEDLRRFLDSGDPPVYITFGSMIDSDPDPRDITKILIEATRMAGCRAIIQSNWNGMKDLPDFPEIYRVTRAPHLDVFHYCAAVVHHGGAGTTQTAAIAGRPSIVVEHASDQPLWGSVLHRTGIAPKLLHRRSLTSDKLARAIKKVLNTPEMKDKAESIAAVMKGEDGVSNAIELIEKSIKNYSNQQ